MQGEGGAKQGAFTLASSCKVRGAQQHNEPSQRWGGHNTQLLGSLLLKLEFVQLQNACTVLLISLPIKILASGVYTLVDLSIRSQFQHTATCGLCVTYKGWTCWWDELQLWLWLKLTLPTFFNLATHHDNYSISTGTRASDMAALSVVLSRVPHCSAARVRDVQRWLL